MILGFTGTREGLILDQRDAVCSILDRVKPTEAHHGDCVGADEDFHEILRYSFADTKIVIHPPSDNAYQAFCEGDEILPAKPYLDRNRDIVDACELLIACPAERTEQQRGGTWYSIRYARKVGRKTKIIYPDGSVSE